MPPSSLRPSIYAILLTHWHLTGRANLRVTKPKWRGSMAFFASAKTKLMCCNGRTTPTGTGEPASVSTFLDAKKDSDVCSMWERGYRFQSDLTSLSHGSC